MRHKHQSNEQAHTIVLAYATGGTPKVMLN